MAGAGGGEGAAEPLSVEPAPELEEEPCAADGRTHPALGEVLEESAREVLHGVVLGRAHHVVVEPIVTLAAKRLVVHALGIDLVEGRAARLEQVFRDVGGGRGHEVRVPALHEPRHQRPEAGARQRSRKAETDEPAAVDHVPPRAERLAQLAALERRRLHALQEPAHRAGRRSARLDEPKRAARGPEQPVPPTVVRSCRHQVSAFPGWSVTWTPDRVALGKDAS